MTASLIRADLDRFRTVIADRLGLQFDEGRMDFLSDVLHQRIQACGGGSTSYLEMLESDSRQELRVLASRLTVSETYFFRNPDQFRALRELALPERMNARGKRRELRLLSAGCASGEEAFSLAITLRDHFPRVDQWDVRIRAVDVSPEMIDKAVRSRYSAWSLRETSADVQNRYFRKESNTSFVLNDSVRKMVSFEERNLAEDDAGLWSKEDFDVIFCRNVIMYLVPASTQRIIEVLSNALAPGGFLFLGHAETLRGLSHEFHLRHTHNTFYYQKREKWRGQPAANKSSNREVLPAYQDVSRFDESWVDVIRTASERIQNLARDCDKQPDPAGSNSHSGNLSRDTPPHSPVDLGVAFELLRQEKFREALDVLHEVAPESTADADAQLLRAVLLTNCGEVCAAEAVCAQLLAADDLNAGAHYVMALCREHAGDRSAAMEQDRLAVHLDPTFAIPHLHLGLLAQRSGDLATARHELQQVMVLLLREDASRILLFGGGFSREALLEFSRTQLCGCGGRL